VSEMNLPPADTMPPGSTVIGTSTDERSQIRTGLAWIVAGTLAAGLAGGFLWGRRRCHVPGRANNPFPMLRW
jgi:hypothetical protein